MGEGPEELAVEVAAELGLPLAQDHVARLFETARDIAENDLVRCVACEGVMPRRLHSLQTLLSGFVVVCMVL